AKPEIAARCAFHDRLTSGQLELVVEACEHSMVTAALNAKSEIGEAKLLVELGISAARDVEIEMIFGLVEHLDIHSAATRPNLLRDGPQRRRRLSKCRSPSRAVLGREPAYGRVDDILHRVLYEPLAQHVKERDQNPPLDLATLQVTDSNLIR